MDNPKKTGPELSSTDEEKEKPTRKSARLAKQNGSGEEASPQTQKLNNFIKRRSNNKAAIKFDLQEQKAVPEEQISTVGDLLTKYSGGKFDSGQNTDCLDYLQQTVWRVFKMECSELSDDALSAAESNFEDLPDKLSEAVETPAENLFSIVLLSILVPVSCLASA